MSKSKPNGNKGKMGKPMMKDKEMKDMQKKGKCC